MGKILKTKNPLTFRQHKAVIHFVKSKGKSMAESLRFAGYSQAIVKQPSKVFGSPAVIELLDYFGYRRTYKTGDLENRKEVIGIEISQPKPEIDIINLSSAQVIQLKDILDKTPDPEDKPQRVIQEFNKNFVPIEGTMESNFSLMNTEYVPPPMIDDNYSSM